MLINRQILVNALDQLKPGLSNKDIIESGMAFNFHKDQIVTFNDLISVSIPLDTGIEGAVRAEELHKLLDRIVSDDIELTQTESELRLKAGKIKAGLSLKDQILPPLYPEADWLEVPKQFMEAINFCQFSTSKEMTRPHLTCIHFQGTKVSSSDNWRITQFIMDSPIPYDFLLPADAAAFLTKYNITHMSLDPAWIHFAHDESGLIFSVRRKLADFINVDSFFEIQGNIVKLPDLTKTLERTKIMVEGDSDRDLEIKIILADNALVCRGEKGIGWVEEKIDIEYEEEPVTMLVNPIFLTDILSRSQEIMIGQDACLFWGPNFRHVLRLVKK